MVLNHQENKVWSEILQRSYQLCFHDTGIILDDDMICDKIYKMRSEIEKITSRLKKFGSGGLR